MNYTVKRKTDGGKFHSYGNVKKNQFGNYSLGMKATPELKAIFANAEEGSWLNFSLFETSDKLPEGQKQVPSQRDDDSEPLPF